MRDAPCSRFYRRLHWVTQPIGEIVREIEAVAAKNILDSLLDMVEGGKES